MIGLGIAFNPCYKCDEKAKCNICELTYRRNGQLVDSADLAEDIFAAIEEMVITEKSNDGCALYLDKVELAELKKKYTEVAERREVSENNTVRCFHPSVTESQRVAERREVSENNTVRCFHPSVTESQREAERREDIENSPVDCSTPSVTESKGDTE